MPGNDPAALAIFCCGVLCCALVPRILARPTSSLRPDTPPRLDRPARWTLVSVLSTLLCAVGALLLVPWSAALTSIGASGWFLGLILVILVAAGALYALARHRVFRESRQI